MNGWTDDYAMTTTRRIAFLGALAVGLSTAACGLDAEGFGATGSFDRTLSVTGPVDLTVATGSGRIQIRAGSQNRVRVVAEIRAHGDFLSGETGDQQVKEIEARPPVDQSGNTITIGEGLGWALRNNVSISYDVLVPSDSRVRSRSGSGSQAIEGVGGSVDVRAGSGRVEVTEVGSGDLDVRTGSGAIVIAGARGAVRVRAGSGRISVEGEPRRDWSVRTGSGRIDLRVPAGAHFDLEASTGSGSIRTAHALEVTGEVSRHRLAGKVGGGGARIETSTGSGSTDIE